MRILYLLTVRCKVVENAETREQVYLSSTLEAPRKGRKTGTKVTPEWQDLIAEEEKLSDERDTSLSDDAGGVRLEAAAGVKVLRPGRRLWRR